MHTSGRDGNALDEWIALSTWDDPPSNRSSHCFTWDSMGLCFSNICFNSNRYLLGIQWEIFRIQNLEIPTMVLRL